MLASSASVADSFISRLIGLLGTESLSAGQGLYISPCHQIHMYGMRYAIDAVFIDRNRKVVGLCEKIKPGQISPPFLKAAGCLELPEGTIEETGTRPGDEIEFAGPTSDQKAQE